MNHRIRKAGAFLRFVLVTPRNIPGFGVLFLLGGYIALDWAELEALQWPFFAVAAIGVYLVSRALYKPDLDSESKSSLMQVFAMGVTGLGFCVLVSFALFIVVVLFDSLDLVDILTAVLIAIMLIWLLVFLRRRWREFNRESVATVHDGD